MYRHASHNRAFRIVWNASKSVWQAVCEIAGGHGKAASTVRLARRTAAVVGIIGASSALAAPAPTALPTGGKVVAGSATIGTSGSRMDINQSTQRAAIDWNTFNIGSAAHVHFQQPAGGVALNRVLGSDASQIYGKLTATGQVFLINPNGVLFAPGAQVDVGGLVASTLAISNSDFMAGNYKFSGTSSNAIINQGNITARGDGAGGTIALIAAKITNDGTLAAEKGNVLLGAGSKVTLDMGGPVKLQVENDMLETLIRNGGVIKADGGRVLLTSQAAGTLASSVINNTGVIEAQTLATGEKGEIILFAHDGVANVGGRLDASAPVHGDGGFIETSGARVSTAPDLQVTTLAAHGETGNWLIDPATYTVAASGGDETGAALAGRLAGTNIILQADNLIAINDPVSWATNKLTLRSGNDIAINATMTATGGASLTFEYGQSSANGSGATYTVGSGAKIYIPDGGAFTWKKGSAGTTKNLVFDNGLMRFGNGTQDSFTASGQLEQPFYFDNVTSGRNGWYKLTFSSYPLDAAVASGGDGTNSWNINGQVLSTQGGTYDAALSSKTLEISGYREGTGTIVASSTVTFASGQTMKVDNAYRLDSGANYLKTDTTVTNTSASAIGNLRLWVGTRDDYVGPSDSNYKFKGNLDSGFTQIGTQNEQAKAIKIAEANDGVTGAAILFYSTSAGADTVVDSCCSFNNVTNKNPRTSTVTTYGDGSYALFMRLSDLAPAQSGGMTWYYAAAPASQINTVIGSVATSAGVSTPPAAAPVTPATTTETPSTPQVAAVSAAQRVPTEPLTTNSTTANIMSPVTPPPTTAVSGQNTLPVFDVSGGLAFVDIPGPPAGSTGGTPGTVTGGTATNVNPVPGPTTDGAPATGNAASDGGTSGNIGSIADIPAELVGRDPMGFMRVFVVGGGLKFPTISLADDKPAVPQQ